MPVEVINIPFKTVVSIQNTLWKFKWIEWILIRGQIAVGKWTTITVHSINLDRPLWWLVKTNVVTGRSLGLNRSNKLARWLGKRLEKQTEVLSNLLATITGEFSASNLSPPPPSASLSLSLFFLPFANERTNLADRAVAALGLPNRAFLLAFVCFRATSNWYLRYDVKLCVPSRKIRQILYFRCNVQVSAKSWIQRY